LAWGNPKRCWHNVNRGVNEEDRLKATIRVDPKANRGVGLRSPLFEEVISIIVLPSLEPVLSLMCERARAG
jgi:hypothetical protein